MQLIYPSGLSTDLVCRPVGGSGGSIGGVHCYLVITPETGSSLGTAPITLSLLTPDMKVGNEYLNASVASGPGTYRAAADNGKCNASESLGQRYLIFLDEPYHFKSFELVISDKDKWLVTVKSEIKKKTAKSLRCSIWTNKMSIDRTGANILFH